MWTRYLIGLLVLAAVALVVPMLLPGTIGYVVSVIAGIGALVCVILLVVALINGRTPPV